MTDTDHETRGCPPIKAVRAPPELDRFATAVRRLQDLTVSTNPHGPLWTAAAERVEDVCALLEAHEVPEGAAPAGRATNLPGLAIRCYRHGA